MVSESCFLIISNEVNSQYFTILDDECTEEALLNGYVPTKDRQNRLKLVHDLIKKLFDTIPLTKLTIVKTLKAEFPFFRSQHCKITAYIDNLLKLLEYAPCFTNEVLKLIFENILLIDVNVTKDQIDQAEEEELVELDEAISIRMRLPLAETLDHCMEHMLRYFHHKFSENSNSQNVISEAIFEYFEEHVIKTFTKHMHFILFYISSVNVSNHRYFVCSAAHQIAFLGKILHKVP